MYDGTRSLIDGAYYRFADSGAMITGWHQDSYGYEYYGTNGVMYQDEWYNDGHDWYYLDYYGDMETGYTTIDGDLYYFEENGTMQTGWISYRYNGETEYTYHGSNGRGYEEEWLYENGNWYYFDFTNDMVRGTDLIDGRWYYFNQNGTQHRGWLYDDGKYEYHGSNGAYEEEWLYEDGKWYYFSATGRMVTGYWYIDGIRYYFYDNGVMA